jgi:hypothetical protein
MVMSAHEVHEGQVSGDESGLLVGSSRSGLFDTCPCDATAWRKAPV